MKEPPNGRIFRFLCQNGLQKSVTYVGVSSLFCKSLFLVLHPFSSVWQDVDLVNILREKGENPSPSYA